MSSSFVRVRLGWALAILSLAIAGPAWADDPKQEAKARYTTGQSHYNLNEFQESLQDFKEAYRLFPDPVFLFNGDFNFWSGASRPELASSGDVSCQDWSSSSAMAHGLYGDANLSGGPDWFVGSGNTFTCDKSDVRLLCAEP